MDLLGKKEIKEEELRQEMYREQQFNNAIAANAKSQIPPSTLVEFNKYVITPDGNDLFLEPVEIEEEIDGEIKKREVLIPNSILALRKDLGTTNLTEREINFIRSSSSFVGYLHLLGIDGTYFVRDNLNCCHTANSRQGFSRRMLNTQIIATQREQTKQKGRWF